jgi:cyanophycinase-like exopeptidase
MNLRLLIAIFFTPCFTFSQSYNYYFDGDTSDVNTNPTYGICLMGGATENDQGAQWFLNKADGGNVLVLRTSGGDGYQNYFYNDLGITVQSVETIVLNNATAATDPFVLRKIENAEAIWLAGGDQYLYELYFKNSTIKTLLNEHVNLNGSPIGGTSAGMAVLGEFYFNAENGTITSNEALSNPYDQNLTVESSFIAIPILENTITDTHYDNPDRKGRHIAFISRMQENDVNADYFGIAADEYVSICIDQNGIATVYGEYPNFEDNAYFLRTNCQRIEPSVLQSNTPLTWSGVNPAILSCNIKGTTDGQNQFDLNVWLDINGGNWEGWSVEQGVLLTEQIQFSGCTSAVIELETDQNDTYVYPNPTLDIINVKSEANIIRLEFFDNKGNLLISKNNVNYLSINNFEKGIYQLRITKSNHELVNRKIIVIH